MNDCLQELADHLKDHTNSTAVYIGKLIQPNKSIKDDSVDTSHIDADAEKVVRFGFANKEHAFLVKQTLRSDQGLTFDVFRDVEEIPVEAEEGGEPEEGEEGEEKVKKSKEPQEKLPRHILVPEVVREPRMHFFKVPRLGSYLAIRLEYESCLFEESFDLGLTDYLGMRERQKQLQEDMKTWEEQE